MFGSSQLLEISCAIQAMCLLWENQNEEFEYHSKLNLINIYSSYLSREHIGKTDDNNDRAEMENEPINVQ